MAEMKLNIVLDGLNKIKDSFKGVAVGVDKKTGGKGSAGAGFGKMAVGIFAILGVVGALLGSVESVGAIMKVVGALLNSLVAPFVPILLGLLKPVLVVLQILMGFMLKFFRDPVGMLQKAFEAMKGAIANLLGIDPAVLQQMWENLKAIASGVVTVFKGVWTFLKGFFSGDFKTIWEGLKMIFSGLWTVLKGVFSQAVTALGLLLGLLWKLFVAILKQSWENLKTVLKGAWMALKFVLMILWTGLKKIFLGAWDVLKNVISSVIKFFVSIFEGLLNGLKFVFNKVLGFFKSIFHGFGTAFRAALNAVISLLNKVPGVNISKIGGGANDISSAQPIATNISINIEGSADQKTVDSVVTQLRGELNRRGTF